MSKKVNDGGPAGRRRPQNTPPSEAAGGRGRPATLLNKGETRHGDGGGSQGGDDRLIYQTSPPFIKPSLYRPKGWTETVAGYLNEAKKLTLCILRNRKAMTHPYQWAVHINLNEEVPPAAVTAQWVKACRSLRRAGVVGLWVREPNRANKVHYHLIVKNGIGRDELERAVEAAMPGRAEVRWRKRVERIKNEWFYAHYLTKAKVAGQVKGRPVSDRYRAKRLLFKSHLKFKKYGVIGPFWERPKRVLWDEIKAVEQQIAEGLEKPGVWEYARMLYEMMGEDVSWERVERSCGFWADHESVRKGIEDMYNNVNDGH